MRRFLLTFALALAALTFVNVRVAGAATTILRCTGLPNGITFDEVGSSWIKLQVGIPGVTATCTDSAGITAPYTKDMSTYIAGLYKYFVGAIAILAAVMVFYGGLKWLSAGGNASRVKDAKETIFSALVAIVISLGSYLLLYTINPRLVNLRPPVLKLVQKQEQQFMNVTRFCDGLSAAELNSDGKDVPCGQVKVFTPPSDTEPGTGCMGSFCDSSILSSESLCLVTTGPGGTILNGTCKDKLNGVGATDKNISYPLNVDVVTTSKIYLSCGDYVHNVLNPTGSDYIAAAQCSANHAHCVAVNVPIQVTGAFGSQTAGYLTGHLNNVLCSDEYNDNVTTTNPKT